MMQAAEMVPVAANSNDNATNPAVKLESNDDSDEEGEINEEKEDISNLYDDFPGPQPSPAKENNDKQSVATDMQEGNSDDDNDMFGDDANSAKGVQPILKKEEDNFSQEIRKPITSLQFVTIKENHADPNY